MSNMDAIRARLAEIDSERRAIDQAAGDKPLDADQQTRWDALENDETEARAALAEAEKEEARAAKVAESRAKWQSLQVGTTVPDSQSVDVRSLSVAEARDRALKRLEAREGVQSLSSAQMDKMDRLIRVRSEDLDGDKIARALLASETDAYRSAFMKGITQAHPVFTPEEARAINEVRAASLTDTSGGYGVPVLIDPTIILTSQESVNVVRQIATVKTITTDAWKGVSSAGVTWSWDAEAAEVSDDGPTLAQPTITAHKAQGFIPYSIEIGQDYPAFAQEFGRLLAEGYDELQAAAFVTGAGDSSNAPYGILTALDANTNVEVTPTTDGLFAAADIDKAWTALPDRAKNNATWLMSSDVASYIALWGDAYGGRTVDLAGQPTTLRGRPLVTSAYMPEFTGTTGAANILIVGDFRRYYVVDRVGMTVENIPHLFGTTSNRPTGQRGIFAYARVGADSVDDTRFRLLQNQ